MPCRLTLNSAVILSSIFNAIWSCWPLIGGAHVNSCLDVHQQSATLGKRHALVLKTWLELLENQNASRLSYAIASILFSKKWTTFARIIVHSKLSRGVILSLWAPWLAGDQMRGVPRLPPEDEWDRLRYGRGPREDKMLGKRMDEWSIHMKIHLLNELILKHSSHNKFWVGCCNRNSRRLASVHARKHAVQLLCSFSWSPLLKWSANE